MGVEADLGFRCLRRQEPRDFKDHLGNVNARFIEPDTPGIRPAQVEDLVDQPQQMRPAGLNAIGIVVHEIGTRCDLGSIAQQLREANYRIQRCPELVAHIGEEHGLGCIGFKGPTQVALGLNGLRLRGEE